LPQALSPEVLAGLLEGLQSAQQGLRAVLHALGLAHEVHGQPAWPFDWRVAAEMLVVDKGLARSVLLSLLCVGLALLAALASLPWRRARWPLWAAGAALLILAPWPPAHLLMAPAVPTSLHQSPTGFAAQGIVRGQGLYQQHCVRCHGADGAGQGRDAASLAMWPPDLTGALLWKRLDGELFWRVRHGMQARSGAQTMPGVDATQLSDAQVWEVLDYLQAHAAGQMLRASGAWSQPVRVPDASVVCRHGGRRSLRSLSGQRLRIAVPVAAPTPRPLEEDPRLVTLLAQAPPDAFGDVDDVGASAALPECASTDPHLLPALALVLGQGVATPGDAAAAGAATAGYQLIVDRAGWLRARGEPGQAAWSEDDLVCRSTLTATPRPQASPASSPPADGLDALIRRMDAEPVRLVRGGFPH
jgi:mono/diheme cytochrome c family protein